MTNQQTDLTWRTTTAGVVPIATQFDDPYYSLDNGLAETHHVFIAGNSLPTRFGQDIQIAELGFGTGLNFLALVQAYDAAGRTGQIHFTSFEAYPLSRAQAAEALGAFPDLDAAALLAIWDDVMQGPTAYAERITLEVITGDARTELPAWQGRADAWFLDGFSPAKNPEMWEADLMHAVAEHTLPGGTLATFTAAGHVRRALSDAGFTITRVPGFGRKRHMTTGTLAP